MLFSVLQRTLLYQYLMHIQYFFPQHYPFFTFDVDHLLAASAY